MKFLKHSVTAMAILTLAGGALAADRMLTADVVVVGASSGGLTAGVAATDAGLKTIVLEPKSRGIYTQRA